NPFSLFAADARSAWFASWSGPDDGARVGPVACGFHTLTNTHDLDELAASEVLRAAEGGPVELPRGLPLDEVTRGLERVARSHAALDGGPRSACCVHGQGRGTVSSAIVAVDVASRPALYLAADGPPCVTPYRDVFAPAR